MEDIALIGTMILAAFGLALSIYQEVRHNNDMKTQARLEYRVNQLTIRLTETLEQLRRAREIIGQIHLLVTEAASRKTDDLRFQSSMAILQTEWQILAQEIDDKQLNELADELKQAVSKVSANYEERAGVRVVKSIPQQIDTLNQITSLVGQIHKRIYRLIQEQIGN